MNIPAYLLGTAVRIRTKIDDLAPTSVQITIRGSSWYTVIEDVNMSQVSSDTWEYIWQSPEVPELTEDEYDIYITVTSGIYRTVACETISMLDPRNRHNIPK